MAFHRFPVAVFLGCAISFMATAGAQTGAVDVAAKRDAVLRYLSGLSRDNTAKNFQGTVCGQNCYHGSQILDESWERGYKAMVEELHAATGKWPGIIGVDYEWAKIFSPEELSKTNKVLIDYANSGGLVTVNFSPLNPWVNDESDIAAKPGSWQGPDGTTAEIGLSKVTGLDELLNPKKPVHEAWMRKLDRIADALAELRDAGVVVLFRPMQEPNGNWFWWGMKSHPSDPGPYKRVYRHMREYFSSVRKLDNLLWVYSPNASMGQDESSSWNRPVDWAYPGDAYVDIVAGTNYDDEIDIEDYAAYLRFKKPLGMAELGPRTDGPAAKAGSWKTRAIIDVIRRKYPKFAYFVCWHSYPGQSWSIISNADPAALMNAPGVITRDGLPAWN